MLGQFKKEIPYVIKGKTKLTWAEYAAQTDLAIYCGLQINPKRTDIWMFWFTQPNM